MVENTIIENFKQHWSGTGEELFLALDDLIDDVLDEIYECSDPDATYDASFAIRKHLREMLTTRYSKKQIGD